MLCHPNSNWLYVSLGVYWMFWIRICGLTRMWATQAEYSQCVYVSVYVLSSWIFRSRVFGLTRMWAPQAMYSYWVYMSHWVYMSVCMYWVREYLELECVARRECEPPKPHTHWVCVCDYFDWEYVARLECEPPKSYTLIWYMSLCVCWVCEYFGLECVARRECEPPKPHIYSLCMCNWVWDGYDS